MPLPEPKPGLVISYAYLWEHEARQGREEGVKDRPCAIVLAARQEEGGDAIVTVLPVTHTQPVDARTAIEIPRDIKQFLGLDDERSWIVLDEANRFHWPGPDLRPVPGKKDEFAYGPLPGNFYRQVVAKWHQLYKGRRLKVTQRSGT